MISVRFNSFLSYESLHEISKYRVKLCKNTLDIPGTGRRIPKGCAMLKESRNLHIQAAVVCLKFFIDVSRSLHKVRIILRFDGAVPGPLLSSVDPQVGRLGTVVHKKSEEVS